MNHGSPKLHCFMNSLLQNDNTAWGNGAVNNHPELHCSTLNI